uniref:Uncharacterized protein n=1 Tax=Rhizophora mucronata TaxID=61149 RepID=A0A2P2N225_RHIMU
MLIQLTTPAKVSKDHMQDEFKQKLHRCKTETNLVF